MQTQTRKSRRLTGWKALAASAATACMLTACDFQKDQITVIDMDNQLAMDGPLLDQAEKSAYPLHVSPEVMASRLEDELKKQGFPENAGVVLSFVVNKEGQPGNVEIMGRINSAEGRDDLIAVESFKKVAQGTWEPGRINGKAINQRMLVMAKIGESKLFEKTDVQRSHAGINADNEIFEVVEVNAHPDGGMQEYITFIMKNLKYPDQAKRDGIQGKVFVKFVVDTDGSLTDIEVAKGIGYGCDEEAIRVMKMSGKWTPGKQRGKVVKQRMILPIKFSLG